MAHQSQWRLGLAKLADDLAVWDGLSVQQMKSVYARWHEQPAFLSQLLNSLKSLSLQAGATWLLKHHLTQGATLDARSTSALCRELSELKDWPAQLHALQMLDKLNLSEADLDPVESFAREGLRAENKFVRAWSYHAMYLVSLQRPELQEEVSGLFERAMQQEAASVKARLRQILKDRP